MSAASPRRSRPIPRRISASAEQLAERRSVELGRHAHHHPGRQHERLILLAQSGEEDAFSEFVVRHTATVHRWMARAVGEQDADAAIQGEVQRVVGGVAGMDIAGQEQPGRQVDA